MSIVNVKMTIYPTITKTIFKIMPS